MDELVGAEASAIVMTSAQGDPPEWKQHVRDKDAEERLVLSENHIRTYWWCSPANIGMETMLPDRWTALPSGAFFSSAKCVRA